MISDDRAEAKVKTKKNNCVMRKIIAIGESVLDTLFHGSQPVKAFVGGRVANAAASLASTGVPCHMVSECTTDRVGDIIIDFLTSHGVDVTSVDRYPDGATRLSAIFDDGECQQIVNYGAYPKQRFDVVWPRIDENDIVLIGSLYAVDLPQRARLLELLKYATERKAIIVYLPGLQHGISFRITHVMPHLLENMELSQLVVATSADIATIFPGETCEECFHNHISFYDNTFVYVDSATSHITVYTGNRRHTFAGTGSAPANLLGWQSGLTAGIIHQLLVRCVTLTELHQLTQEQWRGILDEARRWADDSQHSPDNTITSALAAQARQQLATSPA